MFASEIDGLLNLRHSSREILSWSRAPAPVRHTFAHDWLATGGQEHDLMRLAGWRSREMVGRYAASAADGRARDAHRLNAREDRI
jgi:hypothetical protein